MSFNIATELEVDTEDNDGDTVGQLDRGDRCCSALLANRVGDGCQLRRVSSHSDDVGAITSQALCRCLADPTRCARNDCCRSIDLIAESDNQAEYPLMPAN
jgi:hypothetical protein